MFSSHPLVVLDTSVVSIIYNQDQRAPFYENEITGFIPVLSFQTLEELHIWPIRRDWGDRRRNELMRHISQYEVIWPNLDLVRISAELRDERERAGRRLNTADAWIAATAILLECHLASDDRDFSGAPNLSLIRRNSRL